MNAPKPIQPIDNMEQIQQSLQLTSIQPLKQMANQHNNATNNNNTIKKNTNTNYIILTDHKLVCDGNYKHFDISRIKHIDFEYNGNPREVMHKLKVETHDGETKIFNGKGNLGKGTYGFVELYTTPTTNECITLKYITTTNRVVTYQTILHEINIINALNYFDGCNQSYVKAMVLYSIYIDIPCIIMEYMDGTIFDLITTPNNTVSDDNKLSIFRQLINACLCLYKYKLVYADIKLDNIMYKCLDDKIQIVLCDLGSIANMNLANPRNETVATYPPIDRCINSKNIGVFENPTDKDIVWGLCMVGLMIFDPIYHTYKTKDEQKNVLSSILPLDKLPLINKYNHTNIMKHPSDALQQDIGMIQLHYIEKYKNDIINRNKFDNLFNIMTDGMHENPKLRLDIQSLYDKIVNLQ